MRFCASDAGGPDCHRRQLKVEMFAPASESVIGFAAGKLEGFFPFACEFQLPRVALK